VLVEHRGHRPQVDPTAWIAPNAVISGNIIIGPRVRILYSAVLTAEGHVPLTVGQNCVIMEQAVLRAAGRWGLELGDYVLVGPHAYLSGCSIGVGSFIATGAMVFNGARLGTSCVVALGGKVISKRTCRTIRSCRLASSPSVVPVRFTHRETHRRSMRS
jgi:carbonic anhydrase/acetyltransferase-like protein (isoleucine patch superfamily)